MSSSYDKFQKRRLISSYFSVVLSIFLVLFLLGALGIFIINSKRLANDFRENIAMTVFLKDETSREDRRSFEKEIKTAKFIKSIKYVSKQVAAKQHTDIIGEDFLTFLGENPLQDSYDIYLKADYVVNDSIVKTERELLKSTAVSDIVYDKQLINLVNDNIKKVSMWILIVTGVIAFISVLLINSSLRLSIHSSRFIIKTMQMVGATKKFIRKPFIQRSVKLGIMGAGLAIVALILLLAYIETNFPSLGILEEKPLIALVFLVILGVGILITWVSTYFAAQRFLNLKTDDLY